MMQDFVPHLSAALPRPDLISPATLSFVGDAVHTLYVRTLLTCRHTAKPGALHRLACARVCASAQAQAFERVLGQLGPEEREVALRCRNAHTPTVSKNAPVHAYRLASGFEGLLGWLYLSGQHERMLEILNLGYPEDAIPGAETDETGGSLG